MSDNISGLKSGFIALAGRPNVGKSTLLNRLIGNHIAITSHKPQTTRRRILGVLTSDTSQMVFMDTPGIHKPKSALGEMMVKEARSAIAEADIRCIMVSAPGGLKQADRDIIEYKNKGNVTTFLVINKSDAVKKEDILNITHQANELFPFDETVPISATEGDNVDTLLALLEERLGVGPKFFPDDYITDMPERVIWSEFIRARALLYLQDEVPHGVAVEIMSAVKREDRELVDMEATIFCERDTHKGIIIGKKGEMLKRIGAEARRDLERLVGMQINLNLWVKVKKDWRDKMSLARSLGGFDNK